MVDRQPAPHSDELAALDAELDNLAGSFDAQEVQKPDVDPAVAGAAGAAAVGDNVEGGPSRRDRVADGLIGDDHRGRRASRPLPPRPLPPPTADIPPAPSRPVSRPIETTTGHDAPAPPAESTRTDASADPPNREPQAKPPRPRATDSLIGDGHRARRASRQPAETPAPAPWLPPEAPADYAPASSLDSEPTGRGFFDRLRRRGGNRQETDAPASSGHDTGFFDDDTAFSDRPYETPPVEKPRSLLTPAGLASWISLKTNEGIIAARDRLQYEQDNPKTMKWINIGTVALAGARMLWGGYTATKGLVSSGPPSAEAMQVVTDTLQSGSDGQAGTFTEDAIDAAAMHVEPVAFETPLDTTAEAATVPPVDPGNVAPAATALGDSGGETNPNHQGTIWGETMDSLQDMGYDTNTLTDKQKYDIVDDVLAQQNLSWDQAANLQADYQVQMPSANAMEGIMDQHEIAHGELTPTAEAPEVPDDSGNGGDTGEDGNNGDGDEGSTGSGNEQTTTPTPTPETTTPTPTDTEETTTTTPPPSTEETTTTTPPPTSTEETTTPTTSSSAEVQQAATSNKDGLYNFADETLTAAWQSAAIYGAGGVLGGIGLGIKENIKAPATGPRRRTPRRRPGRGSDSSRP